MTKRLSDWDFWTTVRECKNVYFWNPELALEWMLEVHKDIKSQVQQTFWDQTATHIYFKLAKSQKSGIVDITEGKQSLLKRLHSKIQHKG